MNMLKSTIKPYIGAMAVLFAAFSPQGAMALDPIKIGDVDVGTITGYIRTQGSWNLEDHPDRDFSPSSLGAKKIGGKGDMSMWRSSLYLQYVNSNLPYDSKLTLIGRVHHETRTSYLNKLDRSVAQTGNLMNFYNDNSEAIREAYIDIPLSDRVKFRFGKQQVVWGETDLLQALDLVNPRDLSWRSLFEPEDEEWRKPLIMANFMISVPEAKGSLQLIYRPGWDKDTQMGNTLDLVGGRWSAQGSKGVNTLGLIPYNYHHKSGDTDDASYGFRWTGIFGQNNIGYSLAYYHTLSDNPILNVSVPGVITPYKGSIGAGAGILGPGVLGEFILPEIDIIGGSLNYPLTGIDMVLRSELAVTLDKPYNAGHPLSALVPLPTIKEETTAKLMIGFDKPWRGGKAIFGTVDSPFWTVQIFDSWIPGFKKSDQLFDVGTSKLKEHSVIAVTTFNVSYNSNTVNPGVALAVDTSNGGGAIIPSVNILYGDHWRLRMDMPIFFLADDGCSTNPLTGKGANCTHLFGTFDNNNQFSARLTYQF